MTDEELKQLIFDYNFAVRMDLTDMLECDCGGLLYGRLTERGARLWCMSCKATFRPGATMIKDLETRCGKK